MSDEANEISLDLLGSLVSEMMFLFDREGRLLSCSDYARTEMGYFSSEYPGNFSRIFPGAKLDETGRKPVRTDMYRKNETCFPVVLKINKVNNDVYFACADDRTDVKALSIEINNLKEELNTAQAYKNEFVSNITHELRTPVNGILGMARALLDSDLTPYQLDYVNTIERSCINMSKIINDMLDFSKMAAGKLTLENKPFAFRDFINKTMASNVTLINEKGLKLILNVSDDIPKVLVGDELRLTQILNNFMSNAIKFTTVGHIAVDVSLTKNEENYAELFFMVMDTGIGIAKEDMNKLFKSFSQVDASITRRFGGTGLGLSICRQLVEMMGGSIKVESEEGRGSSFSFSVILGKPENEEKSLNDIEFPSGNFVYEGNGQYTETAMDNSSYPNKRHSGLDFLKSLEDDYELSTEGNLKQIKSFMDKLIICIELGNWEKAENFSSAVKNLISDDESDKKLKRDAFRLELVVRRESYDESIKLFNNLKAELEEMYPESRDK